MVLDGSDAFNNKIPTDYIVLLEEEKKTLQEKLEKAEKELFDDRNRMRYITNILPNFTVLKFEVNLKTLKINTLYLSDNWEKISNLSVSETLQDTNNVFRKAHPDDLIKFKKKLFASVDKNEEITMEVRYFFKEDDMRWLKISVKPIEFNNNKVIMDGFVMDITIQKNNEIDLVSERNSLKNISDNILGGAMLRFEMSMYEQDMQITYLSKNWQEIMGLTIEESMNDFSSIFRYIHPDDATMLTSALRRLSVTMKRIIVELRLIKNYETKWVEISLFPHIKEERIIADGFIHDITERKNNETELIKHRDKLEILIKERTEELEFVNTKLMSVNDELEVYNNELNKYQTQLESMVEEKTKEVLAHKEHLEKLSRRQAILINVLHIVQSADSLSQAINEAITKIGSYTDVSRIHVFEKSEDGTIVSCIMGWCNTGIEYIADRLQNIPIEIAQAWFDMIDQGEYVCSSDNKNLSPTLTRLLAECGVKSVVVFPLTSGTINYGFVVFDECNYIRDWDENEVEILRNLTQILSTTKRRFKSEQELIMERDRLKSIGDHFFNGTLFRCEINPINMNAKFTYLSETWEDIMGMSIEDTMANPSKFFEMIKPEFSKPHFEELKRCTLNLEHFFFEYIKPHLNNSIKWIQVSAHPQKVTDNNIVFDGFSLDITDRKLAEQELLIERDRLKSIGDHFPGGSLFSFELDLSSQQMNFTYISGTWEKITGLNREDSLSDISNVWAAIHPEDLERLLKEIKDFLGTRNHFNSEIRILYKGVETRWFQLSSHRRKIANNKIVSDGFILDITNRKKVEAELTKYREELEEIVKERTKELETTNEELKSTNEELFRYKTQLEMMVEIETSKVIEQQQTLEGLSYLQRILINVLESLQLDEDTSKSICNALEILGKFTHVDRVQIWENNPDNTTYGCSYEWCNEGIKPLINVNQNLPREHGKPWFDALIDKNIICTSNISTLAPEIFEILNKRHVKSIIAIPLTKHDSHFGFITFTNVEEREWYENEIVLLTNISQVFSNVIRRRQVETAMKLSQQTMRKVLDNIEVSIFVTDFDTLQINFANKLFKSWAIDNVEGKYCWQALNAGKTGPCNHCPRNRLRDKNNRPTGVIFWEDYLPHVNQWFLVVSTAIEWFDGKLAILEIATDITKQKLNEFELVQARERAEQSDKLKSAFLDNMSHEIRTPLNAIVGFSSVMTTGECSMDEMTEYKNVIHQNTDLLLNLINNILDFSRLEVDKIELDIDNCDIVDLCQTIISTASYDANSNVECKFISPVDSFYIQTDIKRLRQIIINLLSNANKNTREGSITMTFEIDNKNNKVLFSVTDTGCGIPEDKREIVFVRFEKLDVYVQGLGLGLPICKLTINKLGGEIWVDPDYKNGAKFVFSHPITYKQENLFSKPVILSK